ncbi:signal peptidase I [Sphaerisporangium aureirubrum]|uniref:Signal peptidase I n=1 Tax=Sphaerisporangium aureirubrum TaxID=1544736 RepID=A0ABW1NQH4_9ACTN
MTVTDSSSDDPTPSAEATSGAPAPSPEATAGPPEAPQDAGSPPARPRRSGWRESVLLIASGVIAALLVHLFVLDSFWIPSESMEQTLQINDRVIVNKLSGDVGRGEIVVFKGWDDTPTIKRVIGIAGDHVKCCDPQGRISVNGTPLIEDAYLHPQDFPSQSKFDVTVPPGRLWLMGDHRAASEDSRAYMDDPHKGTIATSAVVGRAFARYWPFSRLTTLPVPEAFSKIP